LQLQADLRIEEDRLAGYVTLNRVAPRVEPIVAKKVWWEDRGSPARRGFAERAQHPVAVGGTTSQPTYRLQTDLGERLAAAFKHVARAELEKQLAQQLSLNETEFAQLTQLVSDRIGVGKKLDIGKLGLDEFLR